MRVLSKIEQQFLEEAKRGHFRYLSDETGPIAWGAEGVSNLFSMPVLEEQDIGGSTYRIAY